MVKLMQFIHDAILVMAAFSFIVGICAIGVGLYVGYETASVLTIAGFELVRNSCVLIFMYFLFSVLLYCVARKIKVSEYIHKDWKNVKTEILVETYK